MLNLYEMGVKTVEQNILRNVLNCLDSATYGLEQFREQNDSARASAIYSSLVDIRIETEKLQKSSNMEQ